MHPNLRSLLLLGSVVALCTSPVSAGGDPAPWRYLASQESIVAGPGPAAATVSFWIEDALALGTDAQGFGMAWAHSAGSGTDVSTSPGGIEPAGSLASLNSGAGPDFFGVNVEASGWTLAVVFGFVGSQSFLSFPAGSSPTVTADYLVEVAQDDVITIEPTDLLGSPPVINEMIVSGEPEAVAALGGSIDVTLIADAEFVRADCNNDGVVDLADAIWTLEELFLSGPASSCPDACDTNGDGTVDTTDAGYTLAYRFLDGPPPPAPFPGCGLGGGPQCAYTNCP